MIQIIIAMGALCPVAKQDSFWGTAQERCLRYYAECVGDFTKYSAGTGSAETAIAEKLRQCMIKK